MLSLILCMPTQRYHYSRWGLHPGKCEKARSNPIFQCWFPVAKGHALHLAMVGTVMNSLFPYLRAAHNYPTAGKLDKIRPLICTTTQWGGLILCDWSITHWNLNVCFPSPSSTTIPFWLSLSKQREWWDEKQLSLHWVQWSTETNYLYPTCPMNPYTHLCSLEHVSSTADLTLS